MLLVSLVFVGIIFGLLVLLNSKLAEIDDLSMECTQLQSVLARQGEEILHWRTRGDDQFVTLNAIHQECAEAMFSTTAQKGEAYSLDACQKTIEAVFSETSKYVSTINVERPEKRLSQQVDEEREQRKLEAEPVATHDEDGNVVWEQS
jgi:hypothetical protein